MIICKDCGKSVAPEECRNLKVNDPKETFGFRLDQLCEDCFKVRLKDKAENPAPVGSGRYPWGMDHDPLDKSLGKDDIFNIIYKAMESKDRQVCIVSNGKYTTVRIEPYEAEEPRWIHGDGYYVCTNCGCTETMPSMYCPNCGEQNGFRYKKEIEPDGDTEC